ncbi:MAG: VWA domain-containing protein [Phycisphaerales bacterium]|nr:VWA domain-containing protein [Phycisphaerales bacterium]
MSKLKYIVALWAMGMGVWGWAQQNPDTSPLRDAIREVKPPEQSVNPAKPPLVLEPNQTQTLEYSADNRGIRLTVHSITSRDSYGLMTPPPGDQFLVLDTQWQNQIPLSLVYENKIPTEYVVPNLADHLYVVADGSRVLRLVKEDVPGLLPIKNFRLGRLGDVLRGNALFVLPKRVKSLELRFYDFAHGHIVIPLMAPESGLGSPAQPIAPAMKNEVIEAGIFGVQRLTELEGHKAPDGRVYLQVDLRARSLFTFDADATAFDPKARPGQKMKIGTVADWKESRQYLQLVADGVYAYGSLPRGTLEAEPRFLPDLFTGGMAVFCVPDKVQSLELRLDFPNAAINGKTFRPKGIVLAIEGTRPPVPKPAAIATADDGLFNVAVTGQTVVVDYAGSQAPDGGRFLKLDLLVKNVSKQGELFQTGQQLQFVSQSGQQSQYDPASLQGLHPPMELLWIPAGEQRAFEVVYAIGADQTKPRLAYLSPMGPGKILSLQPIQTDGGSAEAKAEDHSAIPDATPPEHQPPAIPEQSNPAPPVQPPQATQEQPAPPPAPTVQPPPQPKGLAGVGLKAEQVNDAIDRGTAFLWEKLKKEDGATKPGYFGARQEHVLCALALVHAGAQKRFPEFDVVLRNYLSKVDATQPGGYEGGLLCMLIESYGDPTYYPKLKQATRYLLEAQGKEGTWTYNTNLPKELFKNPDEDRVLRISGGTPLEGPGSAGEQWTRLTDWAKGQDGDNSVSQFALLGLHSASRSGIRLPAATWAKNLEAYRDRQNQEGGWSYHGRSDGTSYGSMSCAGICAIAINRFELGEAKPADDPAITRGLTWLTQNFDVKKNPRNGIWNYYYIYSLERVGQILGTEFIGDHEWYPLGARYLVDAQKPDGSWVGEGNENDPRLATSFALLFLTRATATLNAERPHGGDGMLKTSVVAKPSRLYIILDASGSMLEEIDGKRKFDIARDAVAAMINEMPDDSQVALRVYGHRKSAIEKDADQDTELLLPMGTLNKKAFLQTLQRLRCRGKTPLAFSLQQAAGDIGSGDVDRPMTLVLLTDGGEDSQPRQDPVKIAAKIAGIKGLNFHIVGFNINRPDWTVQLRNMALAGKGHYWVAEKSDSLLQELRAAVLGTPDVFIVTDSKGREVYRGKFGDSEKLPEGKYHFSTEYAGSTFEGDFWINTQATTSVVFDASRMPASSQTPAVPAPPTAPPPSAPPADKTDQQTPRFCTHCGAPLAPGAKFCTRCGTKVQ